MSLRKDCIIQDVHTTYFPGLSTADDTWTQNELENIGLQAEREAKKKYAEPQAKRFGRIARYSLDDENKKKYENKEKRWKTIEKSVDSDIIESVNTKEISDVEIATLGKINKVLMEKEFGRIQTDDIIITSERMHHIKLRHPEDYELFKKFGPESVTHPDLIIKDLNNKGTFYGQKVAGY